MNSIWSGWSSQGKNPPLATSPSSAFAVVNKKTASSQPFTEDNGPDDEEPRLPQIRHGNFIRQIPKGLYQAPEAKMVPRKDVFDNGNAKSDVSSESEEQTEEKAKNPKETELQQITTKVLHSNGHKATPAERLSSPIRASASSRTPTPIIQSKDASQTVGDGDSSALAAPSTSSTNGQRTMPTDAGEDVAMDDESDTINEQTTSQAGSDSDNGSGDSDEDDLPEGFYEVEAIQGHKFVKNQLYLLVKWKGYAASANTFEPEDGLRENAAGVIDKYFKTLGGRPDQRANRGRPRKTALGRPLARPNANSAATQSLATRPLPPKPVAAIKNVPKPAIPHSRVVVRETLSSSEEETLDDEEDSYRLPTPQFEEPVPKFPPDPQRGSWDDMIARINHLERTCDDDCLVGIHWLIADEKGEKYRTLERYYNVKLAAPESLFKYYQAIVLVRPRYLLEIIDLCRTFDNDEETIGIPAKALQPFPTDDPDTSESENVVRQVRRKRQTESSHMSLASRPKKSRH